MLGMVQSRENLRLAPEPGEAVGIVREMFRQELQGDIALQLGVARAKHDPHPSFTKRCPNDKRTNACSRFECQSLFS